MIYYELTPEEQNYIANDVLVVKEVLEIMFKEELVREELDDEW